jgi:predicted TIM-barrel fold metal-dependent hydrolase
MPAGAIDVHNHIVGPQSKYPMAATRTYTPPKPPWRSCGAAHAARGCAQVIVQPSFYGFDNSCLCRCAQEWADPRAASR